MDPIETLYDAVTFEAMEKRIKTLECAITNALDEWDLDWPMPDCIIKLSAVLDKK